MALTAALAAVEDRCVRLEITPCRYVDIGELRLHAVIGGAGPSLLLVHGWPETWYSWRLVMPTLARDFSVVAVDQRGIGLSDKPRMGTTPAPRPGTWSR